MENLIAAAFHDHIVLTASGQETFYFIQLCQDKDKLYELDEFKVLGVVGENASRTTLVDYIKANLDVTSLRNHGRRYGTAAVAAYIRQELARAIRETGAYECFIVLGGYDKVDQGHSSTGPSLYFLDYLGTLQKVPYACHGYGATFSMAIMDRYYRPDMTVEESLALVQACQAEIKKRLTMNNETFVTKILDQNGIRLHSQSTSAKA